VLPNTNRIQAIFLPVSRTIVIKTFKTVQIFNLNTTTIMGSNLDISATSYGLYQAFKHRTQDVAMVIMDDGTLRKIDPLSNPVYSKFTSALGLQCYGADHHPTRAVLMVRCEVTYVVDHTTGD
jgi:hypothetical protein